MAFSKANGKTGKTKRIKQLVVTNVKQGVKRLNGYRN